MARGTSDVVGETFQSVAVFGNLLAVAVQNAVKTDPGSVQFYDLTNPSLPTLLSTVTVGALPDMVKFSADGKKLLVTNEGEPNSLYTIDPIGSISLIDTSGYLATTPVAPAQANVQSVDFSAWENRRAELINRGVRIGTRLGVTTTVAQDIEPEAIAISADGKSAWLSLQENNAIAVLDISGATPAIKEIFSAGIKDWSRGTASAKNFGFELEYAAGTANLPTGVLAGGLSGLTFAGKETVGGTELDVYYSITDRGPNGTLVDGKRQFIDPDFQPSIYKLGMNRATGAVSELARIGLKRADGTPLTGLPELASKDDIPVDKNNVALPYDPFGIDSETVSVFDVTIGGTNRKVFAVGDEYRGQIALFDFTTGNLIQRYIPAGQKAQLAAQHNVNGASPIGAETIDSLPAIYGNRWSNRGIEGMAFNSIDGLLYAFMQSPLDVDANGDGVTEGRSRSELTRILAIDPATGTPVKEHLYLLSGRSGATNSELQDKIGDVAFDAARGVFLVMERDSTRSLTGFKHVYEVDLRGATNTLAITTAANQATDGWQGKIGVASPELLDNRRTLVDHDSNAATAQIFSTSSADALAKAGMRLAHKIELFNLPSIGGTTAYDKPEGLTIRDDGSIVINYDNDFGTEGAKGNAFTVVSFDRAGFDSSDRDVDGSSGKGNQYRPISGLPVYSLTMPDGIATYTDSQGRRFLLAAGEGDSREYPADDTTLEQKTTKKGAVFYDLTRADATTVVNNTAFREHPGVSALNAAFKTATGIDRTRLNLLNDYGDINGDGKIDKAFSIGSRSLRIYDDKGNVVFDSSSALEDLANRLGYFTSGYDRDDDKGTEPEMVEVFTVNGSTYAFVALERTPTSVAAVFDVTNPYAVVAVDPIVFPGAQRVEGITFLTTTTNAARSVIASSEGNDVVSVGDFPIPYRLQLLHLSDGEAGLLASQTAPYLAGLVDGFDNTYANTLILAGGDNFIPGPFLNGGTDLSVRDELNAVTGSTISMAASTNHPIGAVDIAIHNLIGVEASTIGNHEFDLGSRIFRDSFTPASGWVGAQFPYMSANLDFSGDADLSSRFTNTTTTAGLEEAASQKGRIVPSAVVTKNGEKIGLVAATTQIIEKISSTGGVEVKGFNGDGSERDDMALLASQLQPVIDDLISQGVNKVILMAHLQQIGNEKALAPLLRGVDIILAAGSNTRLGDSTDQAVAFPGHDANFADTYPIVTQGADGGTTLIVNTDNEYTYLGRLVVDFDAQGRIILGSIDPLVSGAYAATAANVAKAWNVTEAQLATTAFAEGTKAENVQDLTDAVQAVISSKDSQVWGFSNVYLEGERAFVRSEETNLGDLTADANLFYAKGIDPSVVISLKNGGGIRSQIGSVDVVSGAKETTLANPSANKPEGGVSTLDIENSLRFNNSLSLVTVSATKLKELLEHGIALYPNQGRFPQVSGLAFSFDLTKAAGSRIVNLAIQDSQGNDLDVVVRAGALVGDSTRTFRMVTLNFLASGGDSYPFAKDASEQRVDLFNANAPLTGAAKFSGDGTEQDALAEYLKTNYGSQAQAYNQPETPVSQDLRLQNLAVRTDEVIDVKLGTSGADDTFSSDAIKLQGFDGKGDVLFTGAGADSVDIETLTGSANTIFTGSGADVIYAGSRDVITGGGGDDVITADAGNGNRLSGNAGNDDFIIGSSGNRALGGLGDDRFDILETAGTNYLNGGSGYDQFWLIRSGDGPTAKQFVMDFTAGEDKIGLQGVAFSALSFTQVGGDTLLKVNGTEVGHFTNVSSSVLNNQTNFLLA
ncbi:esterase-like activity of phytase family protein [Cyanobium sp. WKJ7-Wakatipu]|nr:esterase-like activity of phytase family protein [Cyanobium sp. WKJ7-Wakatipu]MCP9782045.1 esterase-like activity of phytase family protein [Cyanobium sp. WKJ7-Wakatipu]